MENDFVIYNNYGYNEQTDENGNIIINNTFKIYDKLGEGSYWNVSLVKRSYQYNDFIDNNFYVFKEGLLSVKDDEAVYNKLSKVELTEEDQEVRIGMRELNILSKLNHINISRLYETIVDNKKNKIVFVMEYCDIGCIMNILPSNEEYEDNSKLYQIAEEYGIISEYECTFQINDIDKRMLRKIKLGVYLFKQLALAIKYLHSKLICHRDIKIENIMVKSNKEGKSIEVKLIDFSISRKLSSIDEVIESTQGTDIYKPYEMLNSYEHNPFMVDIYNWGTSFYMFLFNDFSFNLLIDICLYVKNNYKDLYFLIENTLNPDPNKRPSVDVLYERINNIHI